MGVLTCHDEAVLFQAALHVGVVFTLLAKAPVHSDGQQLISLLHSLHLNSAGTCQMFTVHMQTKNNIDISKGTFTRQFWDLIASDVPLQPSFFLGAIFWLLPLIARLVDARAIQLLPILLQECT